MNFNQLESIGYNYIKNLVLPVSAVGVVAWRKVQPFKPSQRELLIQEWDYVEAALKKLDFSSAFFDELCFTLSKVKDLNQTIDRLKNQVLSESELFELKNFLSQCQEIHEFLCQNDIFNGLCLSDTLPALDLLSKSGKGGFFIGLEYSAVLGELRRKKEDAALNMNAAKTDFQRKMFKDTHLKLALAEEREVFLVQKSLSQSLSPFAHQIKVDILTIARLDIIICKAKLAARYKATRPTLDSSLDVDGAYNPLIASTIKDNKFTPITILAQTGTTVITGANMGGKTVALKTIALNVYMALSGFFAFANSLKLPLFDYFGLVIHDLQDAGQGLSSFGGEVMRLNELYQNSDKKGLIMIDEFAAGTNAEEGSRIFKAVVKSFNNKNSIVIMTTHFDGVASAARSHYQVAGLKAAPLKKMQELVRQNLALPSQIISEYMDYGLEQVDKDKMVPKDAINICIMLGLSKDILKDI